MGVVIMTEIKVDNVQNAAGSGKPNFPISPTHSGGSALSTMNTYSYTSSGTEPSSPKNGALWWDSANDKVKVYIDSKWKEVSLNASAATAPVWGGIRGLFVGGGTNSGRHNAIQYITITTPGNGTDFGDLTGISENGASASNQARVVHKKGIISGSGWPASYVNDIDYFAPATTGNASDFGDSTFYSGKFAAVGNGTRGIYGGGYGAASTSGTWTQAGPNIVEYVTIANTGNATDFGDLSQGGNGLGATNDETRGVFLGGYIGTAGLNRIDYITMASAGNSTDFGDTIAASCYYTNVGVVSNNTIGCFSGGYHETTSYTKTNVIQKITIQTAANATDFGDMTQAGITGSQCSDGTTGCIAPGEGASLDDRIDKITIATAANATDFGDLLTANYLSGADGVSGAAS